MAQRFADTDSPNWPLFVGCPVWSCANWKDDVYPPSAGRPHWLGWYSRCFNTVEGNSTFYALPTEDVFQRWAEQAAEGFRFSLKFPRAISHESELQDLETTQLFVRGLKILQKHNRLGPTFLQMGPNFGADRFAVLKHFLSNLPGDMPWALEVRHKSWFDESDNESRLDDLLRRLSIDKVLFDSRPLYQAPPDDSVEAVSQTRKPKTPLRRTVTGKQPMLRLVGRNRIELVDSFFDEWAPVVADWMRQGLSPIVFTHAPDDTFAPQLARRFIKRLSDEIASDLLTVPNRPWETTKQLSFFD